MRVRTVSSLGARLLAAVAVAIAGVAAAKEPRTDCSGTPACNRTAVGGGVGKLPPHVIQDPHYGDTLFHFYQERYFTAITSLMVSQHFDRVVRHADEAEVLRGGMLLSYGLHREAGEIFAKLIDKGAPPPVRDRAWFYLAKIRYQRGFLPEAEDALSRIENDLPAALEEERGLLWANVLMARGDFAGAGRVLEELAAALPGKDGVSLYTRYNLGVALVRSGDTERGSTLLDEIGRAPAATEEYRSLRDRANVALGFAALQSDQPQSAQAYLQRVRLSSMQANKALLGFGWAASSLKAHKEALVPWTELAARDPGDAAVLEAKIAVPYAFAELGAYGQALERYNDAIAAFERENAALDESVAAIRSGKLVEGLIQRNPGEEMGWFWNIRELPEMPHASHLTQVLAQHDFQEAFKNLRDLRFLDRNLRQWEDSLGVFGDMLDNRQRAFGERLPQVQAQARGLSIGALQQQRDALAGEMAQAEAAADGLAYANPKERELLARVESARRAVPGAGAQVDAAAVNERLRRAAGALTWQLAQEHSKRQWTAQKNLRDTDAGLARARNSDAALARAQRDEPARFDAFAARIVALSQRIRALTPQVAALTREQQGFVQELAVAELTRQKDRLAGYATQARFAVAQLYDRANTARTREGNDATKP
jgi:hypothetical protein